jgi:hypothetical protein
MVVSLGPAIGYVQTNWRPGLVRRTYVVGALSYSGVYQLNVYQQVPYYSYVSPVYYDPDFYASASMTSLASITDEVLTQDSTLQAPQAYTAPYGEYQAANAYTPAERQEVAKELDDELRQKAVASSVPSLPPNQTTPSSPPVLKMDIPTLPVIKALDVYIGGQPCPLRPPDVVKINGGTLVDGNKVQFIVESSLPRDCAAGSSVEIDLSDAEEMYDHLSQQLDLALGEVAARQGRRPAGAVTGTAQNQIAADDARRSLAAQQQDADNAENAAIQAASGQN